MNATSLKTKIRNLAREKNIPAQVLLQNHMFERFLERLSISDYKNKFILKGGMLIAAIVGIETRSTMDMDVTIRAYPLDDKSVRIAVEEVCKIEIEDGTTFNLLGITPIRKDDEYGGLRVSLEAVYDTITTPLSLDITSGDVITPRAVRRSLLDTLEGQKAIEVWTYNVETILAEKVETILRRGVFNTRLRDFYDVFILKTTQEYDTEVFKKAIAATASHRGTTSQIADVQNILRSIENSDELKSSWKKYQRDFPYAEKIEFEDIMRELKILAQLSTQT